MKGDKNSVNTFSPTRKSVKQLSSYQSHNMFKFVSDRITSLAEFTQFLSDVVGKSSTALQRAYEKLWQAYPNYNKWVEGSITDFHATFSAPMTFAERRADREKREAAKAAGKPMPRKKTKLSYMAFQLATQVRQKWMFYGETVNESGATVVGMLDARTLTLRNIKKSGKCIGEKIQPGRPIRFFVDFDLKIKDFPENAHEIYPYALGLMDEVLKKQDWAICERRDQGSKISKHLYSEVWLSGVDKMQNVVHHILQLDYQRKRLLGNDILDAACRRIGQACNLPWTSKPGKNNPMIPTSGHTIERYLFHHYGEVQPECTEFPECKFGNELLKYVKSSGGGGGGGRVELSLYKEGPDSFYEGKELMDLTTLSLMRFVYFHQRNGVRIGIYLALSRMWIVEGIDFETAFKHAQEHLVSHGPCNEHSTLQKFDEEFSRAWGYAEDADDPTLASKSRKEIQKMIAKRAKVKQQHLLYQKIYGMTADKQINCRYLSPEDLNLADRLLVKSGTGSGKSTAAREWIKSLPEQLGKSEDDLRVLIISSSRSLCWASLATFGLGFVTYLDPQCRYVNNSGFNRFITSVQSLHHISKGFKPYDAVIIDEIQAGAKDFFNDETNKEPRRNRLTMRLVLSTATRVIGLDACAGDVERDWMKVLGGRQPICLENLHTVESGSRKMILYPQSRRMKSDKFYSAMGKVLRKGKTWNPDQVQIYTAAKKDQSYVLMTKCCLYPSLWWWWKGGAGGNAMLLQEDHHGTPKVWKTILEYAGIQRPALNIDGRYTGGTKKSGRDEKREKRHPALRYSRNPFADLDQQIEGNTTVISNNAWTRGTDVRTKNPTLKHIFVSATYNIPGVDTTQQVVNRFRDRPKEPTTVHCSIKQRPLPKQPKGPPALKQPLDLAGQRAWWSRRRSKTDVFKKILDKILDPELENIFYRQCMRDAAYVQDPEGVTEWTFKKLNYQVTRLDKPGGDDEKEDDTLVMESRGSYQTIDATGVTTNDLPRAVETTKHGTSFATKSGSKAPFTKICKAVLEQHGVDLAENIRDGNYERFRKKHSIATLDPGRITFAAERVIRLACREAYENDKTFPKNQFDRWCERRRDGPGLQRLGFDQSRVLALIHDRLAICAKAQTIPDLQEPLMRLHYEDKVINDRFEAFCGAARQRLVLMQDRKDGLDVSEVTTKALVATRINRKVLRSGGGGLKVLGQQTTFAAVERTVLKQALCKTPQITDEQLAAMQEHVMNYEPLRKAFNIKPNTDPAKGLKDIMMSVYGIKLVKDKGRESDRPIILPDGDLAKILKKDYPEIWQKVQHVAPKKLARAVRRLTHKKGNWSVMSAHPVRGTMPNIYWSLRRRTKETDRVQTVELESMVGKKRKCSAAPTPSRKKPRVAVVKQDLPSFFETKPRRTPKRKIEYADDAPTPPKKRRIANKKGKPVVSVGSSWDMPEAPRNNPFVAKRRYSKPSGLPKENLKQRKLGF